MRIGFIGLGNMGGPMALNLLKAGHTLSVHDIQRDRADAHVAGGARFAASAADVAESSELIFTSLPGPKEVEAVALGENGLLGRIASNAVYADLSTNSPTVIRRIHASFAQRGVAMLDAPVSGGIAGARAATLSLMVGGDEAVYRKIKPALDAIGDKVTYIGAIGSGSVAKLVHNMIVFGSVQLLAEAFTMGVRAGVPAEALVAAVENGAYGQGAMLKGVMRKSVMRDNF